MESIESEPEPPEGALPEPEPRYKKAEPEDKPGHGQAWLRLLAAIIIGLVLVVLIVLLARWVYHKSHHKVVPVPATSQKAPASSPNNSAAGAQPSGGSSTPSGSSSNSASNNPSSSNPSPSSPKITNTGPGDVAAIFVGTSLAAAGLHYLISVRRFAKNS
jgi:hypothetical protein